MHTKQSLIVFLSFLLALIFFFPYLSSGQDKPTVAVFDLSAEQGVSPSVSRLLSDCLRTQLFQLDKYTLVTRENMETILKEQKFQLSGCTSTECIVEAGKLLGVQKMFAGSIGKVGSTYTITLKLFDVETGETERVEEERCSKCEDDSLLDSIDNIVSRVTGNPETPTPRESTRPATGGQKEITAKDGAEMVLIPAGEFLMGSTTGEIDLRWEHPQHKVFLDAYYIDKHKVTVAQYRKFCQETGKNMPSAPSWGWQDNHPIVNVSWNDANAYASYYGKRLLTEAEWEKACRAGSTTKYCFGNSEKNLGDYAWYAVNSNKQTHPVGTKKPNALGLYDMNGIVWEWCNDWYNENYYKNSPTNNPQGPSGGPGRVLRGGGWYSSAGYCRSAFRNWDPPSFKYVNYGFRCASSPDTQ